MAERKEGEYPPAPEPREHVNPIQALQFELIERVSFNSFDGHVIVQDLRANHDLWTSVLMTSHPQLGSLIQLRDLAEGIWNVDTMYILSRDGDAMKHRCLELLAQTWSAEEVRWLAQKEAEELLGSRPFLRRILEVWWS